MKREGERSVERVVGVGGVDPRPRGDDALGAYFHQFDLHRGAGGGVVLERWGERAIAGARGEQAARFENRRGTRRSPVPRSACTGTPDRSSRAERASHLLSYLTRARNLSGIRTATHVVDHPLEVVGEGAQLGRFPGAERLDHDVVGGPAVGRVRLPTLGAELDDGGPTVGGISRPLDVAALAEPRISRLTSGASRSVRSDRRESRIGPDACNAEMRLIAGRERCTPERSARLPRRLATGADARDAHDRLLHALQIVQPGHGPRRYRASPRRSRPLTPFQRASTSKARTRSGVRTRATRWA